MNEWFIVLCPCSERCTHVDSVTVTIFIGGQPRDIGVLCGNDSSPMLMSNNNRLEVTFVSRSIAPVTKGFQATYRFVEGINWIGLQSCLAQLSSERLCVFGVLGAICRKNF